MSREKKNLPILSQKTGAVKEIEQREKKRIRADRVTELRSSKGIIKAGKVNLRHKKDERITKGNKARIAIFSHSFLELLGLKILKVERYKMHKKFKKAVEKHDEDLREEN
ncbi:uncharacterized protein HKW66_Vig0027910 [Vigna angularis]|uniref:Uncharacterized protein n=1 Tax=Phaseolus angularis TaxID=3914 RepID=A0A8T0L7P6_PHAAN|nr:uncharacterized protein HKW66_Vig0027910 [Vigna angularis]